MFSRLFINHLQQRTDDRLFGLLNQGQQFLLGAVLRQDFLQRFRFRLGPLTLEVGQVGIAAQPFKIAAQITNIFAKRTRMRLGQISYSRRREHTRMGADGFPIIDNHPDNCRRNDQQK